MHFLNNVYIYIHIINILLSKYVLAKSIIYFWMVGICTWGISHGGWGNCPGVFVLILLSHTLAFC